MKKLILSSLIAVLVLFAAGQSMVANAAIDEAELQKVATKQYNEAHKDFKDGSLTLSKVKQFEVSAKDSDIKQVVAAVVTYQTVRDNFFAFTHKELIYYDPINKKVLSLGDLAPFKDVMDYNDTYRGEIGKKMHFGVILPMLALILLVPIYFMAIWSKRQYSTSEWVVANNIHGNEQSFN